MISAKAKIFSLGLLFFSSRTASSRPVSSSTEKWWSLDGMMPP